jgi:hypothetical protein
MEPRPADPPSWLPAIRQQAPAPAVPDPPALPPPSPPPPGPRFDWRRLTRSPRGAAGLAVLAAALLLWPFAGLSWIPWLAGLGALVVLRLLRLDGPLRGWDVPLAGLVVVAGLMLSTGPWAWALAASIGVLLAGLAQLPWWRLAAVGAVLCAIAGVGFGWSLLEDRSARGQLEVQAGNQIRPELGTSRFDTVLPALMNAVADNNPTRFCALLVGDAESRFAEAFGGPDCASAVTRLASEVRSPGEYGKPVAPITQEAGGWLVDACVTQWASPGAGPQLGKFRVEQTRVGGAFVVTDFRSC